MFGLRRRWPFVLPNIGFSIPANSDDPVRRDHAVASSVSRAPPAAEYLREVSVEQMTPRRRDDTRILSLTCTSRKRRAAGVPMAVSPAAAWRTRVTSCAPSAAWPRPDPHRRRHTVAVVAANVDRLVAPCGASLLSTSMAAPVLMPGGRDYDLSCPVPGPHDWREPAAPPG